MKVGKPEDDVSLASEWSRIYNRYGKRGKLKPFSRQDTAVYVAQTTKHHAFKSLTAGAKIKDEDGNWMATTVLVDTGAGVTLIRKNVFDKMGQQAAVHAVPPGISLIDASGNELVMTGLVKFSMKLGGQEVDVAALLVPKLGPAILLGMDFLSKAESTIDIKTMMLKLKGHRPIAVDCRPAKTSQLSQSVTLPAYHAAMIMLQAPLGSKNGEKVWVEAHTIQRGVYLARTISVVDQGKITGQVTNTTSLEVKLTAKSLPIQVSVVKATGPQLPWPDLKPPSKVKPPIGKHQVPV